MPKIAFITDIHDAPNVFGWLQRAAKTNDIVLIGGDISSRVGDSATFIEKVVSLAIKAGNIAMVLGNHDWPLHMEERGILHGTTTKIAGMTIGGVGGSIPAGGWPFELDESEFELMLNKMGPVDILLCHEPPYSTACDILARGSFHEDHIGSKSVRTYIETTQPRLACFGHIHESFAIDKLGKTVLVNAGAFYEGRSATIDIGANGGIVASLKLRRRMT